MLGRAMALVAVMAASASAAVPGASPIGTWFDETKTGGIEISRCGGSLCGKIVWLREPKLPDGRIKLDIHNDDPALQKRTICGLPLLSGFTPAASEPGVWEGGKIYNPQDGAHYKATMRLEPDGTLRVRGYLGVSLFGQTQVWTRPPAVLPSCTAASS